MSLPKKETIPFDFLACVTFIPHFIRRYTTIPRTTTGVQKPPFIPVVRLAESTATGYRVPGKCKNLSRFRMVAGVDRDNATTVPTVSCLLAALTTAQDTLDGRSGAS